MAATAHNKPKPSGICRFIPKFLAPKGDKGRKVVMYKVYEVYDSITEDSCVIDTFESLEAAKKAARELAEKALAERGAKESYLANRYDDDSRVEWAIHVLTPRGNWEMRTPYYGVKED